MTTHSADPRSLVATLDHFHRRELDRVVDAINAAYCGRFATIQDIDDQPHVVFRLHNRPDGVVAVIAADWPDTKTSPDGTIIAVNLTPVRYLPCWYTAHAHDTQTGGAFATGDPVTDLPALVSLLTAVMPIPPAPAPRSSTTEG